MKSPLKTLLAGCGALAVAAFWSAAASAQYYNEGYQRPGYERRGYERGYDRGYDRRNERGYDHRSQRGYDRGYDRGYERAQREQGYGRGRDNPANRMTIEEQKRALKNHREAQKKALKRGYVLP